MAQVINPYQNVIDYLKNQSDQKFPVDREIIISGVAKETNKWIGRDFQKEDLCWDTWVTENVRTSSLHDIMKTVLQKVINEYNLEWDANLWKQVIDKINE